METRKLDVKKLVNKGFSWNLVFFSRVPTRIQQIDLDTNLDSCVYNSKAQFKRWLPAESVFFNGYLKHVYDNIVSHAGFSGMRFLRKNILLSAGFSRQTDR